MTRQELITAERQKELAEAERILCGVEDEWCVTRSIWKVHAKYGERGENYDPEKRAAAYLIRVHTKLGWLLLGRFLGGRTNMAARKLVEAAARHIETDVEFAQRIRRVEKHLGLKDTITELRKSA